MQDRRNSIRKSNVLPPEIKPAAASFVSAGGESSVMPPAIPADGVAKSIVQSTQRSFLVRKHDLVLLSAYSSKAGVVLQVVTRVYYAGEIQTGTFSLTTDGLRSAQTLQVNLTDGVLIGVQITVSSGTLQRGQCFIKGQIQQGQATNTIQFGIIGNYITTNSQISWPDSPVVSSTDGTGIILKQSTVALSAFYTVPTNTQWRFVSAELDVLCSAVAGNRNAFLQSVTNPVQSISRVNLVASNNYSVFWGGFAESTASFLSGILAVNFLYIQFPPMIWQAAESINVALLNPLAGDAASSVFVYEELLAVS